MKIPLLISALFLSACKGTGDALAMNDLTIPQGVETPVVVDSYEDESPDEEFLITGERPQVTISSISPAHGPITGDTRVTVRGGPFAGYQSIYPDPKCRFGSDDMVVAATYVRCPEAARRIYETEASRAERRSICLQCESSPSIVEAGPVAFTVSLDGDFSDVTSSMEFYYYKPATVTAIKPMHGPKDGGSTIQVWGEHFLDYGEDTTCSFGVTAVPAVVHDEGYITCVSPSSDVVQQAMPFAVSLNGQQPTKDRLSFWYYNDPQVTVVTPDLGPERGGNLLTIKGENFQPFRVADGELDIGNSTFCYFKTLGVFKRATVMNSTRLTCVAPASYYYRETPVEVTLNAADRTEDNTLYHYYRPPFLFDSEPRQGPVTGNTTVTVVGTNFTDTGNITCKFGQVVVPGKFKSSSEILCPSPPVNDPGYVDLTISMYEGLDSSPVDYLYYNTPQVESILPVSGPDYGGTQIAVMGQNFVDLGGDQAVCVFNGTQKTNATVISQTMVLCDSPSMIDNQGHSRVPENREAFYDLKVSIDGGLELSPSGSKFAYYRKPTVTSVEPPLGPVTGGTTVTVHGVGFSQQAVSKRVVRIGHMQVEPDSFTNETMTFTAPHVQVESTAPVSISLNGQQFTQQAAVHNFSQEVTYDYYDVPYTSNYSPMRGPTNGGTPVNVQGSQYRLRRPHLEDRFWVRFVDSGGSPVAPAKEITDSQFGFDTYKVLTPPVSSPGMTTMQVSLNNQQWHDATDPSGGFEFYQSPHVTRVDPPYGHVKAPEQQIVTLTGSGFLDVGADLKCRFGNAPGQYLYTHAEYNSGEQIKCPVPTYTKPDVLNVEVTVNDQSYTSDNKTYGFFDPFVVDANPKLLSVDGSTRVNVTGIGFVNSEYTAVKYNNRFNPIGCGADGCIKPATFLDKNTLEAPSFPQEAVKYDSTGQSVLWDPFYIDATVTGSGFTENQVELYYYEDPAVVGPNIDESPANYESQLLIAMDFKQNDMSRIAQHAKPKCRFTAGEKTAATEGILIDYPLTGSREPANLDTIHCKTPLWKWDGSEETANLEVSLNGQNYFHVSDFTFRFPLVLNRDVPMAGPQNVETDVNLIGSGFRMERREPSFKWGIHATEVCPNAEVVDYRYYESSFIQAIPGSENLKAYAGEINLPHVDSPVTEGGYYVEDTQKSKIYEKEGPGYLEVGFDEIFQRDVPANPGRRLADGTTAVTLYNYLPSAVEYYTYREPYVQRIHPTSGLSQGGTEVSVIGAWFKYMPEYGIVPHCKFGDQIVRAYFDSTVRLVCNSPPSTNYGEALPFSVSLNGVDWDHGATELKFSYYEEPVMHDIYPDMGNVLGGDEIFIRGERFTNITDPEHFRCKFTPETLQIPPKTVRAHYINQTHIMCPSPGGWTEADKVVLAVTWNGVDYDRNNFEYSFYSIHRAMPRSGPANGLGGDILIWGEGFRADTNPKCLLNRTIYEPVSVTPTEIRCPMVAAQPGDDWFGNVDLAVTANGIKWDNFDGGFQYYEQPTVEDIDPKMGPNEGIGIINFYGANFRADYPLAELGCKIGESVGQAYFVSTRQVKCVVEDLPLLSEEQDAMPARVSLNSYSFTEPTEDTYYRPYGVQVIQPNSGPVGGYTNVIVQGQGFVTVEGVTPRCRFGTSANFGIVEAQIMSYTRLACRVPETLADPTHMTAMPRDFPFSIALSGDEFDPWTESSHKFRLYRQPELASMEPVEAAVGTVAPVYVTVADGSEYFQPMPPSQVLQMDNRVVSVEDQQTHSEPTVIKCKFGRFGESAGVLMNDTTVMCATPVNDESPDDVYRETVNVAVAMNGVDFEESEYSPEFTFVGTAPYLSFTAILLTLLAVGFVMWAAVSYMNSTAQYQSQLPPRTDAMRGQQVAFPQRAGNAGNLRNDLSMG